MEKVFVVKHMYESGKDEEEVKMIGVYSTQNLAQAAVERLRSMPGFQNFPDGFSIGPYIVDKDYWDEGFVTMLGDQVVDESE